MLINFGLSVFGFVFNDIDTKIKVHKKLDYVSYNYQKKIKDTPEVCANGVSLNV